MKTVDIQAWEMPKSQSVCPCNTWFNERSIIICSTKKMIPKETTPKEITGDILVFCREIDATTKPEYISVLPCAFAEVNECYENVDTHIRSHGGTRQYGWTIWEIPNEMIEAEFHTVWRSQSGQLMDVSPKPDGETRILFLPDSKRVFQNAPVDNIRKPLRDSPITRLIIKNGKAINEMKKRNWKNGRVDPVGMNRDYNAYIASQRAVLQQCAVSLFSAGRNDPCPCGSGRKYKKCCGK
jgi:hypothetical protein